MNFLLKSFIINKKKKKKRNSPQKTNITQKLTTIGQWYHGYIETLVTIRNKGIMLN